MSESIAEETLDTILGGALRLYQPRRGYRFSVEAVLLARFAAARPAARVLELGAGCGVVALIYAALARPREVVALEIKAGDVLTVTADADVTIELRPMRPGKNGVKALAHLERFVEPIVPKGSYK